MSIARLNGLLLILSGAALLSGACGGSVRGDCISACERAADCPGGSGLPGDDCADSCDRLQVLADSSGCDGFPDYIACFAGAEDICEPSATDCPSSALGFAFCSLGYCDDHPDAAECKGLFCSSSSSGGSGACSVGRSCSGEPEYSLSCGPDTCTCSADGAETATVPYDPAFCEGEIDEQVAAAMSACGWK